MPRQKIIIGLDVGTSYIRVAVAQLKEGESRPQVLGVGQVASGGLRKGVVVDLEEAVKNIKEAVQVAQRTSGVPLEHAFVSIGGSHVSCRSSKGAIAVSRADGEISEEDKNRAIGAAKAISLSPNREILHVLPRRFSVDDAEAIKDPVGMKGVRLEVDALVVEGASPFIKNLIKCVRQADLDEDGLLLTPLAVGRAVLDKRQRELGVLVLDLGGGTSSLAVFEEGDILHCQILPVGSLHITNDIAIGLRTSIEVAEKIKLQYGAATPAAIGKKEAIDLAKLGEAEGQVTRHQVAEIIEARVSEIFDLVNKELKKIDRTGLLPAGVVLTGGGAKLPGLIDLAKEKLRLPARLGVPQGLEGVVDQIEDPGFATVCGLILSALSEEIEISTGRAWDNLAVISAGVGKIKKWLKGFIP